MDRPCPICGKPAAQDKTNRERPFCSERCRMIDLSKWLDGTYAVPGEPAEVPVQQRPDQPED